ncbi:MAG: hypothetical protein Q4G51_03275 [Dermatophilus congolensis]|nr:hypothetical protein [Dermatophilus congolensis]
MSTETSHKSKRHIRMLVVLTVVFAVVAWLFLFTPESDHGIAWGMLGGAAAGLVATALAGWRARHHADSLTVAERLTAGVDDERDRAIKQRAWALTGQASMVYASATCIALMLGAPTGITSAVLLWAMLVTFYLSMVIQARRS